MGDQGRRSWGSMRGEICRLCEKRAQWPVALVESACWSYNQARRWSVDWHRTEKDSQLPEVCSMILIYCLVKDMGMCTGEVQLTFYSYQVSLHSL